MFLTVALFLTPPPQPMPGPGPVWVAPAEAGGPIRDGWEMIKDRVDAIWQWLRSALATLAQRMEERIEERANAIEERVSAVIWWGKAGFWLAVAVVALLLIQTVRGR